MPTRSKRLASFMPTRHPVAAGWVAGTLEIGVTFPFEYVKTQLQLRQQASGLYAAERSFRGPLHCAASTVRQSGFGGLYRGGTSWVVFAGPRSAVRFGTFEFLADLSRQRDLASTIGQPAVDTVNGFAAGIVEAAVAQTPNQVIAIKMIHDQSPK